MRRAGLAALSAVLAGSAGACPMTLALYSETVSGTELRIRAPAPWEQTGHDRYAIELALHDGRLLWGAIWRSPETGHDLGRLSHGCDRPGPEVPPLSALDAFACQIWEDEIYAMRDGDTTDLPPPEARAPERLILDDEGRALRLLLHGRPGNEPWVEFRLSGCAE